MRGASVVVRSDQKSARDLPCDRQINEVENRSPIDIRRGVWGYTA